jgi:hypothetical protein
VSSSHWVIRLALPARLLLSPTLDTLPLPAVFDKITLRLPLPARMPVTTAPWAREMSCPSVSPARSPISPSPLSPSRWTRPVASTAQVMSNRLPLPARTAVTTRLPGKVTRGDVLYSSGLVAAVLQTC